MVEKKYKNHFVMGIGFLACSVSILVLGMVGRYWPEPFGYNWFVTLVYSFICIVVSFLLIVGGLVQDWLLEEEALKYRLGNRR